MGTTTTTPTPPRFNPRSQQQSIFGSRSQQGVPSQISAQTLTQLQQILARNNGEPQQNSFRTQQQIQSQQQFIPQQQQQQFFPQQQQQQFVPQQQQQQFFPQQQQVNNVESSIQDQIRTQQEFLNKNRHRLSAQPPQQQQQRQSFGNQQFSPQRQFPSQQQFQQPRQFQNTGSFQTNF